MDIQKYVKTISINTDGITITLINNETYTLGTKSPVDRILLQKAVQEIENKQNI